MKRYIIIIGLIITSIVAFSQEDKPKVSYSVEYIFDNKGNIRKDQSHIMFMLGKFIVKRNNQTKEWKCEHKGIIKHKDGDLVFDYYYFYLPTIKVDLYISKNKIVKHGDTFYYRVIFDGQTQLAY